MTGAGGAQRDAEGLLLPSQGEPPLALGLSTRKALSILKEQLEAVLEGHLKERKKCLTWKVKEASSQGAQSLSGMAERRGRPVTLPVTLGCLADSYPGCTWRRSPGGDRGSPGGERGGRGGGSQSGGGLGQGQAAVGGRRPDSSRTPRPGSFPGPSLPATLSHLLTSSPPQEMWRSSFLHHSNRCSCFHWPGASLMLLAVLLLLGCHGGQPAGR